MKDNLKIRRLIGVAVFILVLTVFLIISNRDPVVKEMAINRTAENSPDEEFVQEKTKTKDILSTEETSAPTEVAQVVSAAVPTERAGLESTNPDTVALASGDIQLIELFAFW